jgi:Predicted transcriptional regulator
MRFTQPLAGCAFRALASVAAPFTYCDHARNCTENGVPIEGKDGRNAKVGRLLLWEGRVGRKRLMRKFGLRPVRASQWLGDFKSAHSNWMRWDPRRREYAATPLAYQEADALAQQERTAVLVEMLTPYAPEEVERLSVLPWDLQHPSAHTFSRLNIAIADELQVTFKYASMRNPDPHARTIEPHSLVLAGRRWHVRGYCLETGDFRDFALGRMRDVFVLNVPRSVDTAADQSWSAIVEVRIEAHPALSPTQQVVVRDELFHGAAGRVERCREALLSYMLQELRVAIDPDKQRPPEYQIAAGSIQSYKPSDNKSRNAAALSGSD